MNSPAFKSALLTMILLAAAGCATTLEDIHEMVADRDLDDLLDVMDEDLSMPLHLAVVQGIAIVGGEEACGELEKALSHGSGDVRHAALAGLAENNAIPGAERLCTIATTDKDRNVRKLAEKLLTYRAEEAAEILLRLIDSSDYRDRVVAARCLGSVKNSAAVSRLIAAARRDANSEVRKWAAISLGCIGDPSAKPVLHYLRWHDPDQSVNVEAERALAGFAPPVFDIFVAVVALDCTFISRSGRNLGAEFAEVISGALKRSGICHMVERTKIAKAMEELEFSLSDLADADKALRLGQLLSAQQIIYGELQRDGNQYTVVVKRMKVETGEILQGVTEKAYEADLGQLKTRTADQVVRTF